jgi:hypothetical protein
MNHTTGEMAMSTQDMTTRTRARRFYTVLAAVMAASGLVLIGAPAATAAPASPLVGLYFEHPDGSYFSGTVTFSNRSGNVSGTFHAVGCKRLYGDAYAGSTRLDYRSTSLRCDSTTQENIPLSCDVPGGANHIIVSIRNNAGFGYGVDVPR